MSAAAGAGDLRAAHPEAPVLVLLDGPLREGAEEGRPPRARLELAVRGEEGGAAARAAEYAVAVYVQQLTGPRRLGALLAEHGITVGREAPPPLVLGELETLGRGRSPRAGGRRPVVHGLLLGRVPRAGACRRDSPRPTRRQRTGSAAASGTEPPARSIAPKEPNAAGRLSLPAAAVEQAHTTSTFGSPASLPPAGNAEPEPALGGADGGAARLRRAPRRWTCETDPRTTNSVARSEPGSPSISSASSRPSAVAGDPATRPSASRHGWPGRGSWPPGGEIGRAH